MADKSSSSSHHHHQPHDGWAEPQAGKKRILIATSGSRGDTQPFIAIGLACKAAGHAVRIAVEERLKPLVEEFGLDYFKIAGDPTAILWSQEAQEMLKDGKVMSLMSKMEQYIAPFYQQCLIDYEQAAQGADVIVTGPLCFTQTYCIAEKNRIPWFPVLLGPTLKTSDFPMFFLMQTNLGIGFINRATYNVLFFMLWQNEKTRINTWRQNHLKLPPITSSQGIAGYFEDHPEIPIIMGFNRHLIPTTQIPKDWPKGAEICGFLFVPRTPEEEVAQELRDFVSSAERPPVYLGFGSMPAPNPKALLQAAIQVVKQLDCWAVLCAGWTSLSDLIEYEKDSSSPPGTTSSNGKVIVPKRLLIIKAAPHDWLFPRCSAIVHHCGVGTTGAALRSGSPSVPCPVMFDQPFFGSQLHTLGVGTEPIPFPDLTLPKLLNALRIATTSPQMKERAVNIARDIEEEEKGRGVRHVVHMLEAGKPLSFWK